MEISWPIFPFSSPLTISVTENIETMITKKIQIRISNSCLALFGITEREMLTRLNLTFLIIKTFLQTLSITVKRRNTLQANPVRRLNLNSHRPKFQTPLEPFDLQCKPVPITNQRNQLWMVTPWCGSSVRISKAARCLEERTSILSDRPDSLCVILSSQEAILVLRQNLLPPGGLLYLKPTKASRGADIVPSRTIFPVSDLKSQLK